MPSAKPTTATLTTLSYCVTTSSLQEAREGWKVWKKEGKKESKKEGKKE